jgi:zona occludens toxin (predicted ATPase)
MPRIARVITTITQEIEIADEYEDAGKQEVLNFLAEYQDFSTFLGTMNGDETMRLTSIQVIEEDVEEIDIVEDA